MQGGSDTHVTSQGKVADMTLFLVRMPCPGNVFIPTQSVGQVQVFARQAPVGRPSCMAILYFPTAVA